MTFLAQDKLNGILAQVVSWFRYALSSVVVLTLHPAIEANMAFAKWEIGDHVDNYSTTS